MIFWPLSFINKLAAINHYYEEFCSGTFPYTPSILPTWRVAACWIYECPTDDVLPYSTSDAEVGPVAQDGIKWVKIWHAITFGMNCWEGVKVQWVYFVVCPKVWSGIIPHQTSRTFLLHNLIDTCKGLDIDIYPLFWVIFSLVLHYPRVLCYSSQTVCASIWSKHMTISILGHHWHAGDVGLHYSSPLLQPLSRIFSMKWWLESNCLDTWSHKLNPSSVVVSILSSIGSQNKATLLFLIFIFSHLISGIFQ